MLAEPDSAQALRAVGHLVAAQERTVEFLATHLRPVELPTDRVRRVIADLDDDEFDVRERASRELAALGSLALGELRAALAKTESAEACHRLERLIEWAASPRPYVAQELQVHRAICVLERIGGDSARRVLSYVATGAPTARQTIHAAQAVQRIEARRAILAAEDSSKSAKTRSASEGAACHGVLVRAFGTAAAAYQACFSPGGELLATASGDQKRGQVVVWNVASGDQVRARVDLPSAAMCLAFSPCGRLLAAGGGQAPGTTGGWINVWDLETGEGLFRAPLDLQPIYCLAISPDAAYMATGGHDGHVRVWELATGQLALPPLVHPGGQNVNVFEVAFSPDGKLLASCGGAGYSATTPGKVCLWDAVRGTRVRELGGHAKSVFSVAFSPCGRRLATSGGDQTVRLWETATGTELRTFKGEGLAALGAVTRSHTGNVYSVSFSADGRRLASADNLSAVDNKSSIRVWDVATGEQLCMIDKQPAMYRLAFGRDGKSIARTGKNVELWRLEPGEPSNEPIEAPPPKMR